MAVKRVYNLPQSNKSIGVVIDSDGNIIGEVIADRILYRLLSQWSNLLGNNGTLASVEDVTVEVSDSVNQNTDAIVQNQDNINTANTSIAQINADLVIITNDISTLATDLGNVATALTDHTTNSSAHGATGNIVGNLDAATDTVKGVVNLAADPGDPIGTFVSLGAAEAWAANLRNNLQAAGILA